jgi:hypothetical protein
MRLYTGTRRATIHYMMYRRILHIAAWKSKPFTRVFDYGKDCAWSILADRVTTSNPNHFKVDVSHLN